MVEVTLPQFVARLLDERLNLYVKDKGRYLEFRGSVSVPGKYPNLHIFDDMCKWLDVNPASAGSGRVLNIAANKLQHLLEKALPHMEIKKSYVEDFLKLRNQYQNKELGTELHPYLEQWESIKGKTGYVSVKRNKIHGTDLDARLAQFGTYTYIESASHTPLAPTEGDVGQTAAEVFGGLSDDDYVEVSIQERIDEDEYWKAFDDFTEHNKREPHNTQEVHDWIAKKAVES